MRPYLHVVIVEMTKAVSFVICSVLYQNAPLKRHLKLQAALTRLRWWTVSLAQYSLVMCVTAEVKRCDSGGDTEGCGFKLLQHFKDKLFSFECVMILDAEVAGFFLSNFSHKATAADFVLT